MDVVQKDTLYPRCFLIWSGWQSQLSHHFQLYFHLFIRQAFDDHCVQIRHKQEFLGFTSVGTLLLGAYILSGCKSETLFQILPSLFLLGIWVGIH